MVKGREPWFAAAHGVTKSQIQQSNCATTTVHKKEKEKKGKKKSSLNLIKHSDLSTNL